MFIHWVLYQPACQHDVMVYDYMMHNVSTAPAQFLHGDCIPHHQPALQPDGNAVHGEAVPVLDL